MTRPPRRFFPKNSILSFQKLNPSGFQASAPTLLLGLRPTLLLGLRPTLLLGLRPTLLLGLRPLRPGPLSSGNQETTLSATIHGYDTGVSVVYRANP